MADEHDGRADAADHVAQVGRVSRNAAQRVGRGDDLEAAGLQLLDDGAPAGGLRGEEVAGVVGALPHRLARRLQLPVRPTSTRNLLAAGERAGVAHHVALSVVGTERLTESGYFRAKLAQEKLIQGSSIPYSIVHATQFFEFLGRIVDAATEGDTVRVAPVLIQPMAADDVPGALADVVVGRPVNGTVEIAGPEQFRFDELVRRTLTDRGDPREVVTDPHAATSGRSWKSARSSRPPAPASPRHAWTTGTPGCRPAPGTRSRRR